MFQVFCLRVSDPAECLEASRGILTTLSINISNETGPLHREISTWSNRSEKCS